jgi:tetratricopeptide (TPR) repeat protein
MNCKKEDAVNNISATDIIKLLLEEALKFEKESNINSALECYGKALESAEASSMEKEKLYINVKLGDLYQLLGRLEDGIKHFEIALQLSCLLKDIIGQVDSLIKIASSYLYMNDYNACIEYIEKADKLLSEMDYIKGRVNSGIFWTRYHYFSNNRIRAAEICSNALRLCGEDLLIEKGTMLNLLAELHSSLISEDEYLDLLNQAYYCFEKAEYIRGMIGILNNLGYVYSSRVQDYEKALECFLLVKQKSEIAMLPEFELIAHMNIGELYIRLFKYKEALAWLLPSTVKTIGAYADHPRFYNNALISRAYLQLCKYKEAYKYFLLAAEEADNNHISGILLATYYNNAALLFDELGEHSKAKNYSHKALAVISQEELLLKWEIGIAYEQIKLKTAKNESEVFEILEAVKYSLSKYKNKNTILDIVYNLSIQLLDLGYVEHSHKLFSEVEAGNSEVEVVVLREMYLRAIFSKGEDDKLLSLKKSLNLALKLEDYKMLIRIYNSLGECFCNMGKPEEAEYNYERALESFNVILKNTPKGFRP